MKKNLIYAFISFLIIAGTLMVSTYMINAKTAPQRDETKHNSLYVKAEAVKISESESNKIYRGRISAFDNVSLAAEVQGKILKGNVNFKEGEHFKKNDILVRVYNEDIKAALRSGKSSFLQSISQILPDLKVDFSEEFEKWNNFFVSIDVNKSLPALPVINSNKEKVFLAANNVLTSYYNLQQQEINAKRYTIRAPFDGSFISVNKEIGAVASPGAELANIVRTDKLEITLPVFPSDLKWINKGDKLKIQNMEGKDQTATVSRISSFVDESTQSVNVYLTLYAQNGKSFLLGEYVDVLLKSIQLRGFEIPREAMVDDSHVYELKDKKLHIVKVEILRQLDDSSIITGLDSTQVIVTESLASINQNVDYLAR